MSVEIKNMILGIVTHDKSKVSGGFAPVFYSMNEEESERLAFVVAKITSGMVHSLGNGVYVIVKH